MADRLDEWRWLGQGLSEIRRESRHAAPAAISDRFSITCTDQYRER